MVNDEGIDNPRLRGRKRLLVVPQYCVNRKELIIPDSGDGNNESSDRSYRTDRRN